MCESSLFILIIFLILLLCVPFPAPLCLCVLTCRSVFPFVCRNTSSMIVSCCRFQRNRFRLRGITENIGHPSSTISICVCVCVSASKKKHTLSSLTSYVISMHDLVTDFKYVHRSSGSLNLVDVAFCPLALPMTTETHQQSHLTFCCFSNHWLTVC